MTPQFSTATNVLAEYWRSLPRGHKKQCPRRADFSITGIVQIVAETFLSEWSGPEELRIIQVGTKLDQLLGKDITQYNIFEILPPELLRQEKVYYQNLRTLPCAGVITRHAKNLKDRSFVYRTVQLPLLDDAGEVRYFIGTGSVLPDSQVEEEFGTLEYNDISLLDRRYLDIGAGRPE